MFYELNTFLLVRTKVPRSSRFFFFSVNHSMNQNGYQTSCAQDTGSGISAKFTRTGNKSCRKHLFVSRNFAWWPILSFCMHLTFIILLQTETFGRKLSSGNFCRWENAFSDVQQDLPVRIAFCHIARLCQTLIDCFSDDSQSLQSNACKLLYHDAEEWDAPVTVAFTPDALVPV